MSFQRGSRESRSGFYDSFDLFGLFFFEQGGVLEDCDAFVEDFVGEDHRGWYLPPPSSEAFSPKLTLEVEGFGERGRDSLQVSRCRPGGARAGRTMERNSFKFRGNQVISSSISRWKLKVDVGMRAGFDFRSVFGSTLTSENEAEERKTNTKAES